MKTLVTVNTTAYGNSQYRFHLPYIRIECEKDGQYFGITYNIQPNDVSAEWAQKAYEDAFLYCKSKLENAALPLA